MQISKIGQHFGANSPILFHRCPLLGLGDEHAEVDRQVPVLLQLGALRRRLAAGLPEVRGPGTKAKNRQKSPKLICISLVSTKSLESVLLN